MTVLRPCIDCGAPARESRCEPCRGYPSSWERLSRKARRLQPFCSDCGTTEDLQCDHLPSAWERRAQRKPVRLKDVDVVCGHCNRARGTSRITLSTNGSRRTGGHSQVDRSQARPSREMRYIPPGGIQ